MAQTTPDASLDAEIELKKRSRRRLVGATALALLAAVVLPMVMDHEPKPVSQDIQVRIPSQEAGGFASRILSTKPSATPLPPTPTEGKPSAEAVPAVAKAEAKVEPPKPEAKAEQAKTEAPKPPAAPVAPPVKAEKPPTDKPLTPKAPDKPVPAKAEEARATAALAGGEQWVVQLGAYKEAGNVKNLIAKLKQLGVPAYTENFSSPNGVRTRVRAGPFANREAAEKAQARIKIIGVDGPVAPK